VLLNNTETVNVNSCQFQFINVKTDVDE